MKIIINTDITQDSNESLTSFLVRSLNDVNDDYVLQSNEIFSTDIRDIEKYFKLLPGEIDYKRYRSGLQLYGNVDDTTWLAYPNDVKKLICKEKATTLDRVKEFINDDESLNEIMQQFDKNSRECRAKRFGLAKSTILNNIDEMVAFGIVYDIGLYNLEENYIKHGMEGLESNDPVLGVFDFITSTDLPGNDAFNTPLNSFASIGLGTRPLIFRPDSNYTQSTITSLVYEYIKYGKKIS